MRRILFCFSSAAFLFAAALGRSEESLPAKALTLEKLRSVNAYFMKVCPDPGAPTRGPRPSNIWTRGVYYEGLMALNDVDPDPTYLRYSLDWANHHKWGMRRGPNDRNADDQCCAQTYIDLYLKDPKPERIQDITSAVEAMTQSTKKDDWFWIDALQMAMPVFSKLSALRHEPAIAEKMYQMYTYTKQKDGLGLYNAMDHLWWRDKDYLPPYKEPNGDSCYWSRGNGWVVTALVRVLSTLPPEDPHRAEYLQDLRDMLEALVPLQRDDGFWNVSLHDPTHFGGKETTGTALFVYGMAWGVRNGHLPKEKYLPVIAKAWNALIKDAVHPNGFLGYVQGTGKDPSAGQPVTFDSVPDFEDYGVGSFLLGGTEVLKLTDTLAAAR